MSRLETFPVNEFVSSCLNKVWRKRHRTKCSETLGEGRTVNTEGQYS
jgi:hypothetical protein